jgi:hypothetical protein
MGTGALISRAIFVPALAQALDNADPNLNGPAIDVMRTRGDVAPTAALASLRRIADFATRTVANDPQGDSFVVLGVQCPAEIVNYQSTGSSPVIRVGALPSVQSSPSASCSVLRQAEIRCRPTLR